MPLTVIATFHPQPGRRDELLEALNAHVPQVAAEPGCLSYVPHTVGKDGLVLIESWADGAALKAHAEGEAMAVINATVEPLVAAPIDVVVARPAGRDA
jgi:quinol monooxygenase YgiN